MPAATVADLLERNCAHASALGAGHFDDVQDGQRPAVVSLCCSDSRVSQEGMWDVSEAGWLFTPSNIGNVARDAQESEEVDGNLLYPVANTGTRTVAVVGHTGCGAVTAAYRAVVDDERPAADSIRRRVELLEPVVEAGLDGPVDPGAANVVDQLVEYNVRRQVDFLHGHPDVPTDATVVGFVYDLHGVYDDERGRTRLVAWDDETDPAALGDRLEPGDGDAVASLL